MSETKRIQKLIGKMQVLKFHSPVAENIKYMISDFELDVISVSKSGMLYEFEVKISRGDFKADKKKRKHDIYKAYLDRSPNYFSYVCPKDLIKLSEIGSGVGLYYVDGEDIIEVQTPKRRHKIIHDRIKILEKICRVTSERHFLGGCRLSFENKEHIKKVAKYFKPATAAPDKAADIKPNNMNTELKQQIEKAYLEQLGGSEVTVLEITQPAIACKLFPNTDHTTGEYVYKVNESGFTFRGMFLNTEGIISVSQQNYAIKVLDKSVFPSDEKTIKVSPDKDYNGAHEYFIKNCLGFSDGKTQYADSGQKIQFVQKNEDGSMIPGVQSEQLVIALIDRHEKLNARFPSAQNEKMIAGLQMFLDACKERVQERIDRGVMGDLKK